MQNDRGADFRGVGAVSCEQITHVPGGGGGVVKCVVRVYCVFVCLWNVCTCIWHSLFSPDITRHTLDLKQSDTMMLTGESNLNAIHCGIFILCTVLYIFTQHNVIPRQRTADKQFTKMEHSI